MGSESEGDDAEDEDDSSDPEEEEALEIIDKTGTNMQAMRRTIYLTIQVEYSSESDAVDSRSSDPNNLSCRTVVCRCSRILPKCFTQCQQ